METLYIDIQVYIPICIYYIIMYIIDIWYTVLCMASEEHHTAQSISTNL